MNKNYLEFIKKDLLYIVCLIICLAAILTLSINWKGAMEERDQYWIDEGCSVYINYMNMEKNYDDNWSIPIINISGGELK